MEEARFEASLVVWCRHPMTTTVIRIYSKFHRIVLSSCLRFSHAYLKTADWIVVLCKKAMAWLGDDMATPC